MRLGLEGDEKKIEARLYKKSKQLRETLRDQNVDEIAGEVIYDKIDEIIALLQKSTERRSIDMKSTIEKIHT
jgi:hypothetical protein